MAATEHLETWLSAKAPPRSVGRFSRNSKFDVIGGGVVEGAMPPAANANVFVLGDLTGSQRNCNALLDRLLSLIHI